MPIYPYSDTSDYYFDFYIEFELYEINNYIDDDHHYYQQDYQEETTIVNVGPLIEIQNLLVDPIEIMYGQTNPTEIYLGDTDSFEYFNVQNPYWEIQARVEKYTDDASGSPQSFYLEIQLAE